MGAEFQVESLEDMCSLMCDNVVPEKLCDTCIYRNNVEQLKPCIIYRDNCEYYEREEDMTIEEAIQKVSVGLLNGAIDCDDSDYYKAIKVLLNSIAHSMSIKALEQEPKWIPVSERLPEDMTYVLTTIQTNPKRVRVRSGNYYHGHFHNDNGDTWNATDPEVTAWMPLPKPYEPQEGEEV